jgi:hypothetical protein
MLLPVKSYPKPAYCLGSKKSHVWVKVGKIGEFKYQCRKCNLSLGFAKQPDSGAHCKKGGMHEWVVPAAKK